jgi:hypothetical protein
MKAISKTTEFLEVLRHSSFALQALPDEIVIPVMRDDTNGETKPIVLATVDDIAFSHQGLNQAINDLVDRMDALRHAHDMARGVGAKGADYALEFIRQHGEVSS